MTEKLNPDQIPFALEKLWKGKYGYVLAGINEDDCSILDIDGRDFVITSDFLNANPIAVELGVGSDYDLGRLLVASNVSDLCGTGAKPVAMMLCTMMERGTTKDDYFALIEGVKFELSKIDIPLIGGDTKLGRSNALLGIAIGVRENDTQLFLKKGAEIDDVIWISGEIGSVSAAVDGYYNFGGDLDHAWFDWAKGKLIEPQLPIQKSREISKLKVGKGGTDISDGLGADLLDMCLASNVGCLIDVSKLPINKNVSTIALKRGAEQWNYAFIIGGDFQFIVTTNERDREIMIKTGFFEIGKITPAGYKVLVNNSPYDLPLKGHEDGRKLSFGDEVNYLFSELRNLQ